MREKNFMSVEYEKRLETEMDRELKVLPELRAPETLILRVLRAIEARANLPWFKRAWQTWPTALQAVSFLVLACAFAGLCFAALQLSNAGSSLAAQKLSVPLSVLGALWGAVQTVAGAGSVAIKGLGSGFITGCIVAALLGYALCVGLGAVFLRLGFSLREK